MELIIISFIAGILTVLAPCVFPLLPVIIGGSVQTTNKWRPYLIIGSASIFILIFTLLFKFGETLIDAPDQLVRVISGLIIIIFGIFTIFPNIWDWIETKLKFSSSSNAFLTNATQKQGLIGPILTGAALGPVFTSCSPTYFVIISLSLTGSFAEAFIYLVFYVLGFALVLLLISVYGQKLIKRLKWASNPEGVFKKVLGILFILVGIMIIFSIEKQIQEVLLDWEFYRSLYDIENNIVENR